MQDALDRLGTDPVTATLPRRIAVSAVDQALWDAKARQEGTPLRSLLATTAVEPADQVPLYANLNRAFGADRSPNAFAALAARAVADGFRMVKCAPFDGVPPGTDDLEACVPFWGGLERVRAVRDAIGPDTTLAVDCHWRFELTVADAVLDQLAELGATTVEAVVPERELLRTAREGRALTRPGLRLVAGEMATAVDQLAALVEHRAADIVSPDVKYCGGVTALSEAGRLAGSASVGFAPHNPSGPIANLASAQVLAAKGAAQEPLEHPYGESAWRSALTRRAERITGGFLQLSGAPGLGVELDAAVAAAHPPTPIRRTVDLDVEARGFLN
jgi:galactonate dehydratase